MNNRIPWNDLRLILAIDRAGTLSGAGRDLGLSHATVYRRLGGAEARLGIKLFSGAKSGYTPTLAGEELAAVARQIEGHVHEAERRIVGQDLRPSGTVRVTTLDSFLVGFLTPIFADFQATHQEISLEVAVSNQLFSLSKREADVAIRPSLAPPETLVGRKIGTVAYAVYGRRDLTPKKGRAFDPKLVNWVGPDEAMYYPELQKWMAERALDARCRYRINSVIGMHAAASQGHGFAVLPCYLGDPDQRLARFGSTIPELATDLWILTHPDLRKSARVRALLGFLGDRANHLRDKLAGRT